MALGKLDISYWNELTVLVKLTTPILSAPFGDRAHTIFWSDIMQKLQYYTGNTTSALCKYLHRQYANTKLAKNPESC